ncbi:MAG: class I SAM-dependent methyltransferase [Egibacteraceae bacterium]
MRRARIWLKRWAYSGFSRDRWQQPDRVIAALRLRPGDRVADLGAGAGYFTLRLARAVGPSGVVYAVDTDEDLPRVLAAKASRRGLDNVVTVEAGPEDPCLPEAVDLVLLVNTYHHIPDPARYFTALARSLRPAGRLAVIEALPIRLHRLFGHATQPDRIHSTLAEAGYTRVGDHDFLPRQSFQLFGLQADAR